MSSYQHILCALDLTGESSQVVGRLSRLRTPDCIVSLLHVIEPLESVYFNGATFAPLLTGAYELEREITDIKWQQMHDVADAIGVPRDRRFIVVGNHASEIRQFARRHQVDLIVIGTHGQHGLQLMLGSTASSVLHGAHCDVLAVRIDGRRADPGPSD